MSYCGSWKIDDLLTFCANTHRFDTGAATDSDSVPTYRVYEDETGAAILTGSMALLDGSNTAGFYSEQITLSAANGFEKGKCYSIYITATVNSVAGATHHTFQIEAEVDSNTVSAIGANVITATSIASDAITAAKIATDAIDADALAADAVAEIWAKACAEPAAVVAASPTVLAALSWLLTLSRNKILQTATAQTLKADDGSTTIAAATVSDDGTTTTRGEFA